MQGLDQFFCKVSKEYAKSSVLDDFAGIEQSHNLQGSSLAKLLQLTLVVAMNCEQRQEVITRITQ